MNEQVKYKISVIGKDWKEDWKTADFAQAIRDVGEDAVFVRVDSGSDADFLVCCLPALDEKTIQELWDLNEMVFSTEMLEGTLDEIRKHLNDAPKEE